ncbi:hypothetical protein NM688_g3099 [Phlebia brevispora]|uniref:Uncharacterized protein n=1 Tax=Phlebia brevispora TaxID=194682 RepID=A0ACC1T6Q5_9APHY|nr:hypothetical protein NM688_g3099 [Phlebia brevispora]
MLQWHSLTRRFSVLRDSSGAPVAANDLRSRFEAQRAKGSENQLREEEEDMLLSWLRSNGKQRSSTATGTEVAGNNPASAYSDDLDDNFRNSVAPSLAGGQSVRSTATSSSAALHASPSNASISSGKGSQASRRMSNNLFGSGKFQDYTYMRNAHQRRPGASISTARSHPDSVMSMSTVTSSRAGNNSMYSDSQSLRPVTPEGSGYTNSVTSSPNKTLSTRDEVSDHVVDFQGLGTNLAKAMSPNAIRRMSLALEEVIAEIEDDDQVLVERSPISVTPNNYIQPVRGHVCNVRCAASLIMSVTHQPEPSPSSTSPPSSPGDEAGMAFSSDDQIVVDEAQRMSPNPRSRTTSPIPRLPGYIPGMPRPMTPHETSFDADDQTPSATPRATSPRLPGVAPQPPSALTHSFSSMYRTNSNASVSRTSRPTSPVATAPVSPSPLFFNRTPNGRFTPEDRNVNGSTSPTPDPVDSPVLGRRRPLSPLSGAAFQPMASVSSSRPSTPSNITWNTPSSPTSSRAHGRNGSASASGHSRNGSVISVPDAGDLGQSPTSTRSLRSPALPDSPVMDIGHVSTTSLNAYTEMRPASAMSGTELGSPIQMSNRSLRSPTPTHGGAHSPTSPTFPDQSVQTNGTAFPSSRRSSRQNAHSSFTLSPSHALLLSPIANSSRSSLESAGSSYHSWDDDHKKDRLFNLFSHLDPQSEWHDFSADKSGSSTSRTTPLENQDAEEIVRRQMGLTKPDMVAIQDKLVSAALTKAATPEGRHRSNSVRKRRPSTSQSNYSYNGGDSRVPTPAPQVQAQVAPPATAPLIRSSNSGQIALLDAVLDSIESPRKKTVTIPQPEETARPEVVTPTLKSKASSPSIRQRALADVLFGPEDGEISKPPVQVPVIQAPESESQSAIEKPVAPLFSEPDQTAQEKEYYASEVTTPITPALSLGSPHGHVDATLLALDVQRRAEAATAALRKSPSIPKMSDAGSTRRRISPSQISSPKLVSASTSVDTIPLPSVQTQAAQHQSTGGTSTTRLSSRFKKLRGTLRTKAHTSDESTPYPLDVRTPPSSQTATYRPSPHSVVSAHGMTSATEPSHPRISPPVVPSPPASATPGIKGFMSLFRKQRHAGPVEVSPNSDRRGAPLSPPHMIPTSAPPKHERVASPPPPQVQSAPPEQGQFLPLRPFSPQSPLSASFDSSDIIPEDAVTAPSSVPVIQSEEAALKQLFDAANDLGLDQAALNALVARSPSLSSRPTIKTKSRSNSVADNRQTRSDVRESAVSQSPLPSEGRPSIDTTATTTTSARPSLDVRQPTASLNIRKNLESTSALRPHPVASDPQKAIVRRTIIVPSDSKNPGLDINALNALMRKQSLSRRRRSGGATSVQSNRSLQDRAPTPPPPRSSTSKRFSTDRTPPVPQLPSSHTALQEIPAPVQVEQSSSAYDSLYDMYASDSKASNVNNTANPDGSQHAGDEESGPAVEVIELANGETIWSIVNGLRDDDAESFYDNRRSFASDYSGEGVKVLFKEHGRKGSKGSTTSFLSRKKQLQPSSSANRPETKVFFSTSAQIGRLIESLSRDLDAGSFNITPDHAHGLGHAGHSASSSVGSASDMRWTLEEKLEHMLGSMSANT